MKRFLITLSVLGNLAVLLGVGGLYYFTDGFAFFRAQRERVRSLYEALPVQAGDIVFLGDSITAGAQWNELFPRLPTKNRGIGGDTTDDVLARLHTVTSGKPAKVFLKIGTNDLMAQVSTDEIADNVATILDRIHAASPDTRLYLQSVLPRDALLTPAVRELNAKLEAVAQARNVTWVDVFPVFLDEDGRSIRDDFANDELHLTGAGYVAWRVALAPYVRAKPARARVAPASALPKRKRGKPARAVQRRRARILSQHESLPIETGDIVFLGDSITQGAAWNEMFPNQRVRNRGIGGETTIQILDRVPSVTSGRPGKVFLMIGTNDLLGQVPTEEVAGNVATILEQIQQNSPTTKLYLQSVLPRDALLTARVRDLNRQLEEIALARNITWVDIFPAFLDENGTSIRNDLSNDELHLTGAGYLAWRDALAPYVQESATPTVVTGTPSG